METKKIIIIILVLQILLLLPNSSLFAMESGIQIQGRFKSNSPYDQSPPIAIAHANLSPTMEQKRYIDDLCTSSELLYKRGNFTLAISYMREAFRNAPELETKYNRKLTRISNPVYVKSLFKRGIKKIKEKKYNAAIKNFEEVIRLEPTDTEAAIHCCNLHAMMGKYNKAIEVIMTAILTNPLKAEILISKFSTNLLLISSYQQNRNDFKKALKAYQRELKIYTSFGVNKNAEKLIEKVNIEIRKN